MHTFHLPTRVFFGSEALRLGAPYLPQLGRKALLVTGRTSARKSGAWEDINWSLRQRGVEFVLFDEIEENPSLQSVHRAAEMCREHGCDFVIGVGGGSPMDSAKAVAAIVGSKLEGHEVWDAGRITDVLPVVCMPLTSGTGSEVTPYAVLTDVEHNRKAGFGTEAMLPRLALCDPRYTLSVPPRVTRDTAIDALSHLLEGLYSRLRNPLLYPLIHEGAQLILRHLTTAMAQPDNLPAREALMQAALYGGMTIRHTSTTLQHSVGYPLTAEFGVSHGLANGLVMKAMMELYRPVTGQLTDDLLRRAGHTPASFYNWLDSLDMTANVTLDDEFIHRAVEVTMHSRNMANNPFEVTKEQVEEVYRNL